MSGTRKRQYRCCFTGHRPEKLTLSAKEIVDLLKKEIRYAIADGYYVFITGMSRGTDIWAAEIIIRLKQEEGLPLKLIAASPYEGFEKNWEMQWQNRYAAILREADLVRFICSCYQKNCFHLRNRWMVDHTTRVIMIVICRNAKSVSTSRFYRLSII